MCPEAVRTYFGKIHSQCKEQFIRISRIKVIVLFGESPEISFFMPSRSTQDTFSRQTAHEK